MEKYIMNIKTDYVVSWFKPEQGLLQNSFSELP